MKIHIICLSFFLGLFSFFGGIILPKSPGKDKSILLDYEKEEWGIYYRYLPNGEMDVCLEYFPQIFILREENYRFAEPVIRKAWGKRNYRVLSTLLPGAVRFPCEKTQNPLECRSHRKKIHFIYQKIAHDGNYLAYRKKNQKWNHGYFFYNNRYYLIAEDFGFTLESKIPVFLETHPVRENESLIRMAMVMENSTGMVYVVLNPELLHLSLEDFYRRVWENHIEKSNPPEYGESRIGISGTREATLGITAIKDGYQYIFWKSSSRGIIVKTPVSDAGNIIFFLSTVSDILPE